MYMNKCMHKLYNVFCASVSFSHCTPPLSAWKLKNKSISLFPFMHSSRVRYLISHSLLKLGWCSSSFVFCPNIIKDLWKLNSYLCFLSSFVHRHSSFVISFCLFIHSPFFKSSGKFGWNSSIVLGMELKMSNFRFLYPLVQLAWKPFYERDKPLNTANKLEMLISYKYTIVSGIETMPTKNTGSGQHASCHEKTQWKDNSNRNHSAICKA